MKYLLWFLGTVVAIVLALLVYVAITEPKQEEPSVKPVNEQLEMKVGTFDISVSK